MSLNADQQLKAKNYALLNQYVQKHQTLFTGSSLMEQFPVVELCRSLGVDKIVYNRGIGGIRTDDFLEEIHTLLLDLEPAEVFINIGTNDIREWEDGSDWQERLIRNYRKILTICKEQLPQTKINVMAYYPANLHPFGPDVPPADWFRIRTPENMNLINGKIADLASEMGCNFINVNDGLADETGSLKAEYTMDGVHMYANAYEKILRNLLAIGDGEKWLSMSLR